MFRMYRITNYINTFKNNENYIESNNIGKKIVFILPVRLVTSKFTTKILKIINKYLDIKKRISLFL